MGEKIRPQTQEKEMIIRVKSEDEMGVVEVSVEIDGDVHPNNLAMYGMVAKDILYEVVSDQMGGDDEDGQFVLSRN